MKKSICKCLLLVCCLSLLQLRVKAQQDTLYMHNGKIELATVLKVGLHTISFKYKNEEAERNMGKLAIEKIVYRSGRIEYPSVRHEVPADSLWNNLVVIHDLAETEGLSKAGHVSSHGIYQFAYQ